MPVRRDRLGLSGDGFAVEDTVFLPDADDPFGANVVLRLEVAERAFIEAACDDVSDVSFGQWSKWHFGC